jgi:transposase InsO family protein
MPSCERAATGSARSASPVARLELEGVSRRGNRRRTTTPDPAAPPAPDLVKRRFVVERPDQVWLADISYLPTYEGWLFFAVVMDVCSRTIVGWAMREDLKSALVVDELGMAVARRRPSRDLCITPTAARNAHRSRSVARPMTRDYWPASAAAATPTTTHPSKA